MKLKFLAMKWASTERFRHYLLGGHFTVITDNNPLTYFRFAKLGALEQRWAAQLAQFNFEIKYRPGKVNPAEAHSRMPFDSLPEPPVTEVPPEVASVHETWCEQSAVDSSPCGDVSGDTDSPVQSADKAEERDKAAATEIFPRLSITDLHELQTQDQIIGPVIAAWPAKPSLSKERPMRTLVKQCPRLFLREGVLYRRQTDRQTDRQTSDVVSSSSWLCPAPFGLTLQLFMTRWVTRATNAPWSC